MSFEPDSVDIESQTLDALKEILKELRLMNLRLEEAFETKLSEEDIDHG